MKLIINNKEITGFKKYLIIPLAILLAAMIIVLIVGFSISIVVFALVLTGICLVVGLIGSRLNRWEESMKQRIIEIIKERIKNLKEEIEPEYCGQEAYELWLEGRDSKIYELEDLLEDIEKLG